MHHSITMLSSPFFEAELKIPPLIQGEAVNFCALILMSIVLPRFRTLVYMGSF